MRVGMLIALPAGLGLSVLAHPITALLYPSYDNSIAGGCLTWLGLASIFVCIMLLSNSILQANGMVNLPVVIAAIGGALKLSINYVLVGIESINVVGAAIGTLVCFAAVAVLDLTVIHRTVPTPPRISRIFVKPLAASVVMAACAWAVNGLLSHVLASMSAFQSVDADGVVQGLSRTGNAVATLAAIAVGGVVYLVLIVVLRAISKDDLALMPKGDKLAKLLHIN
jgi:stage V sporulation protein B